VLGAFAPTDRAAQPGECRDRLALANVLDALPVAMLRARVRDAVGARST
jgi:hypothetical protein